MNKKEKANFDSYFTHTPNITVDEATQDWRCWMPASEIKKIFRGVKEKQ